MMCHRFSGQNPTNNVSLMDVITDNTSGTYRKDSMDGTELAISTGLCFILGGMGGYLAKVKVPSNNTTTSNKVPSPNLTGDIPDSEAGITSLGKYLTPIEDILKTANAHPKTTSNIFQYGKNGRL